MAVIEPMAAAVANSFLLLAQNDNISISNMKLQKLVYFAYSKYLSETETPLFNEQFEKWPFGPVLPSLYQRVKGFGKSPIIGFIENENGEYNMIDLEINSKISFAVLEVWEQYKNYSAKDLSDKTHEPDTAWSKVNDGERLNLMDIKNEYRYERAS
ncbi:MAG: DUF4065 domain-containing protein [Ruminococcus sp.]|nr:DUF4065 domain-containing protein [Ruminococcus sp.]